jgi:AbiV family abortive infection protein
MNAKQIRNGIDISQAVGKRLFDDATGLEKKKRYPTSIALYVFAYEEFGRAKYLCNKLLMGKPVEDTEFQKLRDTGKAHTRKILVDALSFGEMLEHDTPDKFESRRQFSKQVGLPFTRIDRQHALALHKQTMSIFGRLHDLKMAMLYADYENGSWHGAKRFSDHALRDVCEYLHYEVIRVYHNNKFNLFQYANKLGADMKLSEKQVEIVIANPDRKAMIELDKVYRTSRFIRCLNMVKSVIESL